MSLEDNDRKFCTILTLMTLVVMLAVCVVLWKIDQLSDAVKDVQVQQQHSETVDFLEGELDKARAENQQESRTRWNIEGKLEKSQKRIRELQKQLQEMTRSA